MNHVIVPSCKCDVLKVLRHVNRGGSHSHTSWITSASVCKVSVQFIFWKALILKYCPPPLPQEVCSMSNVHRPLASKRKYVHMDLAYLVLFKKSSISAYSTSGACLGCHKSVVPQPNWLPYPTSVLGFSFDMSHDKTKRTQQGNLLASTMQVLHSVIWVWHFHRWDLSRPSWPAVM